MWIWVLYRTVQLFFDLLSLAILARVVLSWFRVSPFNPIMRFLYQVTEPVLAPLRRYIPPLGMIDITPAVAIFLLQILEQILLSLIVSLF